MPDDSQQSSMFQWHPLADIEPGFADSETWLWVGILVVAILAAALVGLLCALYVPPQLPVQ